MFRDIRITTWDAQSADARCPVCRTSIERDERDRPFTLAELDHIQFERLALDGNCARACTSLDEYCAYIKGLGGGTRLTRGHVLC